PVQTKLPAPRCVSSPASCLWAASSGKPAGCASWDPIMGCTVSANSPQTVNPGLWSSLTESGNATILTLNPGIYVFTGKLGGTGSPGQAITTPAIAGGMCTVNGSVTSNCGVMIYLACNNYGQGGGGQLCPAAPQTGGYVDVAGNGTISLQAPTNWGGSNPYTGVAVLADFGDASHPGRLDPDANQCIGGGGNGHCLISATGNGSSISGLV